MKNFQDLRNDLSEENSDLYIALEIVGKLMATRDRKNISQRELSRLSGVPQKTISRIENGLDIPKIQTLLKLANVLGLELSLVEKKTKDEQSSALTNF